MAEKPLTLKKNQNHLFSGDWGSLVSAVRGSIITRREVIKKEKREKQTNKEKEIALNGQLWM